MEFLARVAYNEILELCWSRPFCYHGEDMRNRRGGFSLMEIMVVLSIATVVLAIGIPAYVRYNSRLKLKSAAEQLANGIRQAHDQAMKDGDGVVFQDTIPTGSPGTSFAVYAVHNGLMSNPPMVSDDLGFTPTGVVLQGPGAMGNPPGPGPPAGPTNGGNAGGAGGAAQMQPTTPPPGYTVGAVVVVGSQSLVFGQDGSVLPLPNTFQGYVFTNGDSSFQVSVGFAGNATVAEVTAPATNPLPSPSGPSQ